MLMKAVHLLIGDLINALIHLHRFHAFGKALTVHIAHGLFVAGFLCLRLLTLFDFGQRVRQMIL